MTQQSPPKFVAHSPLAPVTAYPIRMSALGPDCVKTRMFEVGRRGQVPRDSYPMLGSLPSIRRRPECIGQRWPFFWLNQCEYCIRSKWTSCYLLGRSRARTGRVGPIFAKWKRDLCRDDISTINIYWSSRFSERIWHEHKFTNLVLDSTRQVDGFVIKHDNELRACAHLVRYADSVVFLFLLVWSVALV
jgi:hypothetical protein